MPYSLPSRTPHPRAGLIAAALILAACAGGSPRTAEAPSAPEPAAPSAAPTPTSTSTSTSTVEPHSQRVDPGVVADFEALIAEPSSPRSAPDEGGDLEAPRRAQLAWLEDQQARWEAIDPALLPADRRIDHDIFGRLLRDRIGELRYRAYLMPFTTFVPFYGSFPETADQARLGSVQAAESYIRRMNGWNAQVESTIALMRRGLRDGVTIPRLIVEPIPGEVAVHLVDDPTDSRFWTPLEAMSEAVPDSARARLEAEALAAIDTSVVAGYRRFHDFLAEEYVPGTRTSLGISEVPDGRAFYEHRVRQFTTLDISAAEVHERGLAEVARIRGEMEAVIERTGFDGTFAEFLQHLRTDPKFYAKTPDELMRRTALVLKQMDGELPRLFGKLPRAPYGIRAIPEYSAPRMTTAYYSGGTSSGTYYVNTYDLPSRPLYEVQALSFHEAVPGHHLQRALQNELGEVAPFRRRASFTAYTEGWALYAERLGLEVGFYEDPYDDFGRLSYEMWRALRLVVDTGIHAFGWTRQEAIDLMVENSALSLTNITTEVDRYISWPGQALGYKMGEIVIRDLREQAETRLGEAFDLRAFHDTVLGTGPVPLEVLETLVVEWIDEQAAAVSAGPAPGAR